MILIKNAVSMKTKHYSFKVIRPGRSTVVFGLVVLLFVSLSYPAAKWISGVWPAFEGWNIVLYFIALGISFFLGNIVNKALNRRAYGEVDFCIYEDTIRLKWLRPIRFRQCMDLTFQLKDIRNYSFSQEDILPGFKLTLPFFRITLKDSSSIRFDTMKAKDKTFDHFVTAIQQSIIQYNIRNPSHPIKT